MRPDKVYFRVDASLNIGSGHVMRCLTLANALGKRGIQAGFVCRAHEGNLISFIEQQGYAVHNLGAPQVHREGFSGYESWLGVHPRVDAEETARHFRGNGPVWVVADHYGIGDCWERAIKKQADKVIVIDDLANRNHYCDLLIDSSFQRSTSDYDGLVPSGSRVLAGTRYCLLRDEFVEVRQVTPKKPSPLPPKRILISLGGVDLHNSASLILDELERTQLPNSTEIDVVIGHACPHKTTLEHQSRHARLSVSVHQGVTDMAQRIIAADLCIGAVGSSIWERCCLGCPSIVATLAPNQEEGAGKLQSTGVVLSFSPSCIGQLQRLIDGLTSSELKLLSDNGLRLVDGLGTERVIQTMLEQE